MKNLTKRTWLLLLIMLALIIPARVVDVDEVATYDEPFWVIMGANYYYALTHYEPEVIDYEYHPAITTLWTVTAAMLTYFPEYRGQGQGYFDGRKPLFENYIREQGKDTLVIMRLARLYQAAFLILLALVAFFLLRVLFDERAAFLAVVIATCAPYYLGNSHLLNHEAMLSVLCLIAFLGMHGYLNKERKLIYLIVSGVAFGLAQLTKSPSIVLIPLVGLMLLVDMLNRREVSWKSKILDAAKILAIWFASALLIYVLLWPQTWVAPGKALYEVYGNAFSYAFQGGRLEVTQELEPATFGLTTNSAYMRMYLDRLMSSSTPLTWLGLLFAAFILFSRDKENFPRALRSAFVYLLILAALFVLLFSIAQGRKSPHYILSSFVALDVVASLGWSYALAWAQKKWKILNRAFVLPLGLAALVAFQLGSSLAYYPYYYTYKNPLASSGGIRGYGEGLDLAAEYLSQKTGAEHSYAIVYAGRGCFSYYYPGRTEHMKVGIRDGLPFIEDIQNADYVVTYDIYQRAKPDGLTLINFLKGATPERVIVIDGVEYARIYKVADLPEDIYNTLVVK